MSRNTIWTLMCRAASLLSISCKGDTNRKVWATEIGWATGTGGGEVSEADQAAFTAQAFDLWFSLPYACPMMWL
jgi:hypothetical protein